MKKGYILLGLICAFMSIVLLGYKKYNGTTKHVPIAYHKAYVKQVPIAYHKAYVEKLMGFEKYENLTFKKIGEIQDPQVILLNCWENEGGDFRKVKIRLKNDAIVEYDNRGGWIKFLERSEPLSITLADYLKVPEHSQKIHKHLHGVTLDMQGEDKILILFGSLGGSLGLLTLIYISPDAAEIIFNQEGRLLEILETEKGYRLLGQASLSQAAEGGSAYYTYPGQKCEILIEEDKLSFKEFPEFNRDNLNLPIVYDQIYVDNLKNDKIPLDNDGDVAKREKIGQINTPLAELYNYSSESWDYHTKQRWDATPGDFCRIELTLPSGVWVMLENLDGGWSKLTDIIKTTQNSAKINKHTYGITLDMGSDNRILILTGYKYTSEPGLLTLLFVTPNSAGMVFNKKVELLEVIETENGYRLLGQLPAESQEQADGALLETPGHRCEILIEHGELLFKEL